MCAFIEEHRDEHGVEPICRELQVAPSTYYAHRSRPASARSIRDQELGQKIEQIHAENYGVYGVRKIHRELQRQDVEVARCTVERLMRGAGLRGISRAKGPRTTRPAAETGRPADLVERRFQATAPNRLWVADITYVRTFAGWVYAAFVIDVFSRRVVGWQVATSLYTELALDALEMGIWSREHAGADLGGLVHHSDRGVQDRSIRYTQRLEEADAVASVGSKGDSYDNALAEAFNSLFKAELVRNKGPWRDVNHLEVAVAEYIDWFNHRRLHGEIGHVPPTEYEHLHAGHPSDANWLAAQGRGSPCRVARWQAGQRHRRTTSVEPCCESRADAQACFISRSTCGGDRRTKPQRCGPGGSCPGEFENTSSAAVLPVGHHRESIHPVEVMGRLHVRFPPGQ